MGRPTKQASKTESETDIKVERSVIGDPVDCHVGAQIERFRVAHRMTKMKLAGILGINPRQLSKMEKGQVRLGASHIYRAAVALGTTVEQLYQGIPESDLPIQNQGRRLKELDERQNRESLELRQNFLSITNSQARKEVLGIVKAAAKSRI